MPHQRVRVDNPRNSIVFFRQSMQPGIGMVAIFAGTLMAAIPDSSHAAEPAPTLVCASQNGNRQYCAADVSGGVALQRTTSTAACLLGRTWGYDDKGVWVDEGCAAEFQLGQPATVVSGAPVTETPSSKAANYGQVGTWKDTWGVYDPGDGFLVGRSDVAELDISAYAMGRVMDQNDSDKEFADHLGNTRPVDPRLDIFSHRVMVFFKGWVGSEKLIYNIVLWTVNTTDQDAIFANIGYQFNRKFNLYIGLTGNPGSRSLMGSHPFWLGHDRVMADEFFRPYFGSGMYANGEVLPGFWYSANVSNNNSALGVTAAQLDRKLTAGGSLWWMPTTHEFGPRGAYGDYESHEKVATRFGVSYLNSPEQSFADFNKAPGNTTLRLADSVNLFETGSLAPGVTINTANYQVMSIDAGVKYHGMFLQGEYYYRKLSNFAADGLLPVGEVNDRGFYVQASFFPIVKLLELYAVTSQIYGDKSAGFSNSSEYTIGMNYYPFKTRNHRLNLQVMDVNQSPVNSTFGYYTGGQEGYTLATSFSVFF